MGLLVEHQCGIALGSIDVMLLSQGMEPKTKSSDVTIRRTERERRDIETERDREKDREMRYRVERD